MKIFSYKIPKKRMTHKELSFFKFLSNHIPKYYSKHPRNSDCNQKKCNLIPEQIFSAFF